MSNFQLIDWLMRNEIINLPKFKAIYCQKRFEEMIKVKITSKEKEEIIANELQIEATSVHNYIYHPKFRK